MKKIISGIRLMSTLFGAAAAMMIFISILIICQMIFVRSILGDSTIWQIEMVTYLMIASTLIGLPYVQLLKGHVNVDMIPMMLPPKWKKALSLTVLAASMVVILLMTFYGYELFYTAYTKNWKSELVWGVRLWIPYMALPIGLGMFFLQMMADFITSCIDDGVSEKNIVKEN